jgi:hypothetical protein
MALSVRTVVCEYCKGYCRVLAHVKSDHLVGAGENPSYPLVREIFPATRGCPRLRAAPAA